MLGARERVLADVLERRAARRGALAARRDRREALVVGGPRGPSEAGDLRRQEVDVDALTERIESIKMRLQRGTTNLLTTRVVLLYAISFILETLSVNKTERVSSIKGCRFHQG